MSYIFIAASPGDRDAVDQLAVFLRKAGWGVRSSAFPSGEGDTQSSGREEALGAHAVLAIWSSQSVGSPLSLDPAILAAIRDRLCLVRIDAATPPLIGARTLDFSEVGDFADPAIERELIAMIGLPAQAATARTPLEVEGPPRHRGRVRRVLILGAGATLLALTGVVGANLWLANGALPTVVSSGPILAQGPSPAGDVMPKFDGVETLRAEWPEIARRGPAAIQAFINRQPKGALLMEARAALARLEAQAWASVQEAADAAGHLAQLSAYRADFPEGAHLSEGLERERRERARIAQVKTWLGKLGYLAGRIDAGLDPETIAAVRAFQKSAALTPTGLIDEALTRALGAAAGEAIAETPARSAAPTDDFPPGRVFRECYVCPEMVVLPSGSYLMGDASGASAPDERPAHPVTIARRFAVGRFEVTNEEWGACVAGGVCRDDLGAQVARLENMPVTGVAPVDVEAFVRWLSQRTGAGYRLLTEAEWEYAARAGSDAAWFFGNQASALCDYANGADLASNYAWRNETCDDGAAGPARVGSYRPNAFGLYDMAGNVWEWTADCWHGAYDGAPRDGSAWAAQCEGGERVLRGGAWSVDVDKLRSSFRYRFAPKPMPFFGFRVARTID